MSAQAAVRSPLTIPPVAELVDSLTESASSARATFDAFTSPKQRVSAQPANQPTANQPISAIPDAVKTEAALPVLPPWLQTTATISTRRFGKSSLLGLVILGHALALYVFMASSQHTKDAMPEPLQVITLTDAVETKKELPPPPIPVTRMTELNFPVEPVVINVADPEATPITVVARPTEATTSAAVYSQPKTVSSVEYIREPAAKYPSAARALKQRGVVTLRALIDADGHARTVDIQHSSGYRVLDDAGRLAVLNALFKPYTENGHVQPVYVLIPIEFGAMPNS